MAMIRPSSDLRNHYNEISEFCHKYQEPVFITKNGSGDLVVMTNEIFEKLSARRDLYRLLDEGLEDMKKNPGVPADVAFADIEKEFGFGTV